MLKGGGTVCNYRFEDINQIGLVFLIQFNKRTILATMHQNSAMSRIIEFKLPMPEPTLDKPYAQVDWVFQEKMSLYEIEDSKNNYQTALHFYKRFLQETNNYNPQLADDPRFYIKDEWGAMALHKVKQWIQATNIEGTEGYLTSYTLISHFSAIRQTMEYAYEHSYIDRPVINVFMPQAVRETAIRTAFSNEEYTAIFNAISPMIQFSKSLLKPYRRTGRGQDPRKIKKTGFTRSGKFLGQGWACWVSSTTDDSFVPSDDNMRWYFENVMECIPLPATPENIKKHRSFLLSASNIHGGLNELYRRWGVSSFIDQDVIMPLLVKLISETGLNVESLLSLKRDCFKEAHPLTGLPYIEYEKPRSGGEKELHIILYDKAEDGEFMALGQKQSQIISKTIRTILELNEPLVEVASEEDRNLLFLHKSTGNTTYGRVKPINLSVIHTWTQRIVKEHDLCGGDGKPLIFALSRFRPTKFTEMVMQGYDIFDIMTVAGHKSITTTLTYIDRLKSTNDFHRTIKRELTTIKENKRAHERRPLPIAITSDAKPGDFIFKAPVCHCKNPYSPPDVVKNSKSYHEGDACTFWNMCLQCENVLITEMNLPKLFAYRSEIRRALGNVNQIPRQGELYKKILMILDEILSPNVLFPQEKLDRAAELSKDTEFEVLDPFIHQAGE
jgi:integrase